jgi:hypothetical protein
MKIVNKWVAGPCGKACRGLGCRECSVASRRDAKKGAARANRRAVRIAVTGGGGER